MKMALILWISYFLVPIRVVRDDKYVKHVYKLTFILYYFNMRSLTSFWLPLSKFYKNASIY
jgi:hypothetical protein